tara:strand:+ start:9208 stop:10767 length:1560 start_codon:yes stop_codon:yes gene_type:complete
MNWMNILKIEEGDITGGDTPNMPNEVIAEELSDEDVIVTWNDEQQQFNILLMYNGNTAFTRSSERMDGIYRHIPQWKLFLSITNELIKVYGDNHNILNSNDYTITEDRNLVFKLTKPAGWEEKPDMPEEIELYIQLYGVHTVYAGINWEDTVLEHKIGSVQELNKIYPIINEKLQEIFLHPSKFKKMDSWKDILKISPTEQTTAQRSETWQKELNDLKAEASNDWGELEFIHESDTPGGEQGGYLVEEGIEVVRLNPLNLTISNVFGEMSSNEVKAKLNYIDNQDLFGRHEDKFRFTDAFIANRYYSVEQLIINLHENPKLEEQFSEVAEAYDDYSGKDMTDFIYVQDKGKINYRFHSILEAQTTQWKEFVKMNYVEKGVKEFNTPHDRAALLADNVVSSSSNMTKITVPDIVNEINANGEKVTTGVASYLKRGQDDAWVKVITNMDNVFYVNTKTPALKGESCRIMLFNIYQTQFCVMTSDTGKYMPYGDHITTILMMLSDEKGYKENDTWYEIMQVI